MLSDITRSEVIMITGPVIMFLVVLELVRRRSLREDYSLLWLGTFGVLVILSLFRDSLLHMVAQLMGIYYPPTALFVIGFGLLLLVMIQFSTVITRLAKENKQAAQHIALLSARVRDLERKLEDQGVKPS
jgi:hypothetical protein